MDQTAKLPFAIILQWLRTANIKRSRVVANHGELNDKGRNKREHFKKMNGENGGII